MWALAGSAAGLLLAAATWRIAGFDGEPEWLARLNADIPLVPEAPPAAMTGAAHEAQRRILNDLLRREIWGRAEVDELTGILRRGYAMPRAGRRMSPDEFSASMLHAAASLALLGRLESGAPIEPAARDSIVEAFVEELDAPHPDRRSHAAVALIVTKSIEDPAVRAVVDRLLDDPDVETRETVAFQLAHYDEDRRRWLASAARDEP